MATAPSQPPNASLVAKDAMFLFDLFRESPTPILVSFAWLLLRSLLIIVKIHIGPFAEKTGAKPNTIIKRLAGIKARNGLNICTTLGNHKRSSPLEGGITKAQPIKKYAKKEGYQGYEDLARLRAKGEDKEVMLPASSELKPDSVASNALPTPATSPSATVSSPHSFHSRYPSQPYFFSDTTLIPTSLTSGPSKRTFQQRLESESEQPDLDGTSWKKVKVE